MKGDDVSAEGVVDADGALAHGPSSGCQRNVSIPIGVGVGIAIGSAQKKTPLRSERGLPQDRHALTIAAFGCLERVQLDSVCRNRGGHVRSQIAISVFPFGGRIRARRAIPSGFHLDAPLAAFALLYDLVAKPPGVGTPLGGHEGALHAFFNRCTNHFNHPPVADLMPARPRGCAGLPCLRPF